MNMNKNKIMKRIRTTAERIDIIIVKNIERVFILDSTTFCFILKSCIIFIHTSKIRIIEQKKRHNWTNIKKMKRWCVMIKEYLITRIWCCLLSEKNFVITIEIMNLNNSKFSTNNISMRYEHICFIFATLNFVWFIA